MYWWAAAMSSRVKARSMLGPVGTSLDLVNDPLQHGRSRAALEVVAVEGRELGAGRDHGYRLEVIAAFTAIIGTTPGRYRASEPHPMT
jgi:hypothetical protein